MGIINRFAINRICSSTPARPRPFSLWSEAEDIVSDYTSWPTLTNREFSNRHLPPADLSYVSVLPEDTQYQEGPPPEFGDVTGLFKRGQQIDSERSTVLFALFAQWFTDSILRINAIDRRKNTSNHQVDLCQIYGLKESTTRILRTEQIGKLKSQIIAGEEYPVYLYDSAGQPKDEFKQLPYVESLDELIWKNFDESRKAKYYATGLERGNSTIGYTAISTLFLREHNRICDELYKKNPRWNDERLFQTARNISIVILLKLVVEDYINHISSTRLINLKLEPGFAENKSWYRTNWVALEFDMLYRWHSLVPEAINIGGTEYDHTNYRVNNALLESVGIGAAIDALSKQPAGKVGLLNTPEFLLGSEYITLSMGRRFRLRSFNEYRERFNFKPIRSFSKLTDNDELAQRLEVLYGSIDNLELYVGLFAENASGKELFGDLMTRMVGVDALSQIFTNPLLSKYVYNESTFSKYGLDIIEETESIQDLVNRNVKDGSSFKASLSL